MNDPRFSQVRPVLDGQPLTGRAKEAALILLAHALIWRCLEWETFGPDGNYRRVDVNSIIADDELLALQHASAPPESVRGLIATLASVRPTRRKSVRRDQELLDAQRREREARERNAAEATAHLRNEP